MPAIVEMNKLSFAYDHELILHDVSLSIEKGEWVGVIGPNGGGKTTLLRLILGFLKPTKGDVRLFGLSPDEARDKVGYVPQSLGFDPKFPLSVLELVLSGRLAKLPWHGHYRRSDRKAAMEALERVHLQDKATRRFGELSGGQRQRALIARALVAQPQLLVLDEFTANLDSEAEASIYHFLQSLKGEITIAMVTHDLDALIGQVDRVLSVRKEITSLPPQEVCEHFALGVYHTPLLPKSELNNE